MGTDFSTIGIADPGLFNSARGAPPRRRIAVLACISGVALLAACGGEPASPTPVTTPAPPPAAALPRSDDPTPAPGAPAGAVATATARTPGRTAPSGPIVWTTETDPATGAPLSQLEVIDRGASRIVAALPLSLGTTPVTVSAEWSYNNTPMPAFRSDNALDSGAGEVWLNFALEAPPGSVWPPGIYQVLVSIDAAPAAIGTVEVPAGG